MTNSLNISADVIKVNSRRLINQIWKLIPMRENNEDWEEHLKTLIEELYGYSIVFNQEQDYLILLSELSGLTHEVCEEFLVYRKIVFSCISLLSKLTSNE